MNIYRLPLVGRKFALLCLGLAFLVIAGVVYISRILPEPVKMGNPKLAPFGAMYKIDRARLGLTPIPSHAVVRIERRYGEDAVSVGYDVMLHISAETNRTVAFRKVGSTYQWFEEQEVHDGPHQYTTVDGTFSEEIVVDCSAKGTGIPHFGYASYFGDDPRLKDRAALTLSDVQPVLREWQAAKPQSHTHN